MSKIPFKVAYEYNPISPLNLAPIPTNSSFSSNVKKRVKETQSLHQKVQEKILQWNEEYKKQVNQFQKPTSFKERDLT